jgi:hypothetical protein
MHFYSPSGWTGPASSAVGFCFRFCFRVLVLATRFSTPFPDTRLHHGEHAASKTGFARARRHYRVDEKTG